MPWRGRGHHGDTPQAHRGGCQNALAGSIAWWLGKLRQEQLH